MKAGWAGLITAAMIMMAGCGSTGDEAVATTATSEQSNQATAMPGAALPQAETRIVSDAFGEVEIPTNPKRISALYREDYLVALGVTPIVQYYNPMWGD